MLVSNQGFAWGRHPVFLPLGSTDHCTCTTAVGRYSGSTQESSPPFRERLVSSRRLSGFYYIQLTLATRPYTARGAGRSNLLLRTSGDSRLYLVGGPNVCSAEERPLFEKRFRGNPQA